MSRTDCKPPRIKVAFTSGRTLILTSVTLLQIETSLSPLRTPPEPNLVVSAPHTHLQNNHKSYKMSDHDASPADGKPDPPPATEHLNIKVTDNNNEVFFKIKRSTKLEKLMNAFCDRQGKQMATVRFLFDGQRVRPDDSPEGVSLCLRLVSLSSQHRARRAFNRRRSAAAF